MKKYREYLILSAIAILITVVSVTVIYLINLESKKKAATSSITASTSNLDLMSEEDKDKLHLYHLAVVQVISRDASGTPVNYRTIGMENPKPIDLQLMNDRQKAWFRLATSTNVQILKKSKGQIIEYRVIRNDSDIIKEY